MVKPHGDITKVNEKDIPDHDVLLAGFLANHLAILANEKGCT